jgi:hypothetical protein
MRSGELIEKGEAVEVVFLYSDRVGQPEWANVQEFANFEHQTM